MWAEVKTGIFLGLLGLAGAGAIMVLPQQTEIGWGLIAISITGFILLSFHHYGLGFRRTSPVFGTLFLGLVFIGFPLGFIIHSFIEQMDIIHDKNAIPRPPLSATTPKSASECKPYESLDVSPSYLMDLYKDRTTSQGDELAAAYIGKCMSITGKVHDIQPNDFFPGAFFVVIVDNAGKRVTAEFTPASPEKVRHIPPDATITVRGEIQSVSNSGLTLRECNLDQINFEP